jgi:hypothetical protein
MTYRADPALDARLAALVEGLPASAAPALSELDLARPYRTPRWVLVVVAVVLVIAAIVAFLLVGGRAADAYTVDVPAGLHPRMTAPEVALEVSGMLHRGAALWPSVEPMPSVDILTVTARGGGGSITWTVRACGPFAGFPKPAAVSTAPHFASGVIQINDATGLPFAISGDPGRRCPG